MKNTKIIVLLVLLILIGLFFLTDLQQYLTLDYLKTKQSEFNSYYNANPVGTLAIYIFIYIVTTALSLPGATILTLAGGGLFGFGWGLVIVSFASTIGATLAFLAARFLFRDLVKEKFSARIKAVDEGINRDGPFYLFTMRLVPLFPFFMINLSMGLTSIKTWTFYWVSQLGMLAGTAVYVNAGTQLAKLDSLTGILSPTLLGSFILLGLFPLIARKTVDSIQSMKVFKQWPKPEKFDTNLVVIGAGSGGLVSAYIAAAVKAKVILIEKHKMGGDCLNTGCVPSKALIRSAKFISQLSRSKEYGITKTEAEFNFTDIIDRVRNVIRKVEPHDSVERYTNLGVEVIQGEARIINPWQVQVTTEKGIKQITTRAIIIAAGARPYVPAIAGIDQIDYKTSDNLWELTELPKRLLVLGGGSIGCELAQSFARLGSRVTMVEMLPRILAREDCDVSDSILTKFIQEGLDIKLEHKAKEFSVINGEKTLISDHHGKEVAISFDQVLIAIGRKASIAGYGLEELNITLSTQGTIATDAFQQTNYPNIFAVGDVAGPYQFTHTASHQAWYAAVNALFGKFWRFRTDYSVIPSATFTDPEVARVGINEQEAKVKKIAYETSLFFLKDLDRAITDNEESGFIKVLTKPESDKILGVTIVGKQAGDLIAEYVLAMKHNIGLNKIVSTIHIYPTYAEANKYAAGVWKRAHAPKLLLSWVERYHNWLRDG